MGVTKFDTVQANSFLGADMVSQGNRWYVKPRTGSDGNDGKTPATAFATLSRALSAATADQNDIVYLMSESNTAASTTDYQSTALDWNKDGVHLIGIGSGSMIGQRSRIAQLSTVKTIEDLFTVSADNCLIANIEIYHGVASGTQTAGRAMVVSGQRNQIVNCQISGTGDSSFDDAGARSLVISGSENIFKHCYIGLDTVIRATQTCEIEVSATAARNILEDCFVQSYTSLSTFKAIAATTLERFLFLKNTVLSCVQNITSAVAPTGAISNTTPNGNIIILGGGVFGYADVTTSDDTKTLQLTYPATTVVDQGVGKATDVS